MVGNPIEVVLFCHVETGTVRDRTILFDRRRKEGVVVALPRIVEFSERERLPIALALTPQASRLAPTDISGFPLGLHLHPRDEYLAARLDGSVELRSDCLAQYPPSIQSRLISAGADAVVGATGRRPNIFVAGNWSENTDTLRILEESGFRYDGSPLPGHVSDCADWGRLPRLAQPYRPSRTDRQASGDSRLLYLPVSQGYWRFYLSPENLHFLGVRYFMAALTEAAVGGARIAHLYFHSPMALDPFFLSEFSRVVSFARDRLGARFVSPEVVSDATGRSPRAFPPAYLAFIDRSILKALMVRRFPHLGPPPGKLKIGR